MVKAGVTSILTLLFVFASGSWAQTKPAPPTQPPAATQQTSAPAKTAAPDKQATPAAAPITPEQAQLQAQIDKLYQLAQDLKTAVAKSNKDTLSIDVIKKADAVEKAAKNLKDQMKSSPESSDHH